MCLQAVTLLLLCTCGRPTTDADTATPAQPRAGGRIAGFALRIMNRLAGWMCCCVPDRASVDLGAKA